MKLADDLFCEALTWLQQNYRSFRFFTERDVVWTVQMRLIKIVEEQNLSYRIFNDHPVLGSKRRALSADLAIVNLDGAVELAAEFKYEPDHKRKDILEQKFPVVFWGQEGVKKDIERIREFVAKQGAKIGYSIFIDEGSFFRNRGYAPHPGSEWRIWKIGELEADSLSILWARAPS